jgi:hypothetical protein
MLARFILVVLVLATFGCSSATYIRANVTENPLDRVAQQAQEDWTVERVDANTLRLIDAWPIHSILSLSRNVSRANLSYDGQNSALDIQYFFPVESTRFAVYFRVPRCGAGICRRSAQTHHE